MDFVEDIRYGPVVGGVEGDDLAVLADDQGGEGVLKYSFRSWGDAEVEVLLHLGEFGEGGGGEVPVLEGLVGVAAGVGGAVAFEDGRGVVGGVEADGEEVGLGVEFGVGLEGLVDLGEVLAHARAEVGEGAAGIDEGHDEDLAAELVEAEGVAGLVEDGEVGDGVAGCGDVVLDGGDVVGAGLGDDDDLFEVHRVGLFGGEDEGGGDEVAGVELGVGGGVDEGVGHGHGGHEAGDLVGLESELVVGSVEGDDGAADVVGLVGGRGGRRGVAAGEGGGEEG